MTRLPRRWTSLAVAASLACSADAADQPHATPAPFASAAARQDSARLRLQPGALATVRSEPAQGFTGPDSQPFEVTLRTPDPARAHARRFGTTALLTSMRPRAANVGQFPCTSCHMGRRIVLADDRIADAHQELEVVHPERTGATCATCHSAGDVQQLALKSGDRVSLDHAYRLCAQCHFGQSASWAAGAHGKRLDGWQGRRVVMGCADCHDPHRPAIGKRTPFRAPQLDRMRSDDP